MDEERRSKIPNDMRIQNRWVTLVAHKEPDGGIIRKSYQPGTDRHAKVDDPQTWTDFKSACRHCSKDHHSGIGFALGDGFCGIILSDCRDPKTRRIEPWADKIIKLIQSYSEVSPSGKGIHIICRANLPEGVKNKTGRFIIYDHDHFFSITGDRLKDSPCGVGEHQKELEQLLGDVIQEHDSADRLDDSRIQPGDVQADEARKTKHDGEGVSAQISKLKDLSSEKPVVARADIDEFPEPENAMFGSYMDMLESCTESPRGYHFFCLAAVMSMLIGRSVYINWPVRMFSNLFVLLVGRSGVERKGTAMRLAKDLLQGVAPDIQILPGISSFEGLMEAMRHKSKKKGIRHSQTLVVISIAY